MMMFDKRGCNTPFAFLCLKSYKFLKSDKKKHKKRQLIQ